MNAANLLATETKYFESKLPDLVKTDAGRFVLIKGEEVIGVFESQLDAIKVGYDRFRSEPFFVRRIVPVQQPLNFSNNFFQA